MTQDALAGAGPDRRTAAGIVENALGAVFDPAVVRQLRDDSPLGTLGMTPADAVCISDAVAAEAARVGLRCELGDSVLGSVDTVADLISAVVAAATPQGEAGG
jgi:hypothetical protein